MKKHSSLLLIAAVASLICGCALGPHYSVIQSKGYLTPPKDQGLVIFYCLNRGVPAVYNLDENRKLIAVFYPKTFWYKSFNPGPLRLSTGEKINKVGLGINAALWGPLALVQPLANQPLDLGAINIEAGKTYYVKVGFGWASWLEQVSEEQAQKELQHCEYWHRGPD